MNGYIHFVLQILAILTIANKNNHYMIKPLLRLLKYWNVSKNYKAFSSYELEKIMVNYYQPSQYQGYDLKKYLLTGYECYTNCLHTIIRKKDWTRQYIT